MSSTMPALSVLVRPSRARRLVCAAAGAAHCAAALLLATDAVHYLGAPVPALASALAGAVLLRSATRRPKAHRIDISGTGDLRVTVQRSVGATDGGHPREGSGAPQRLLPGTVVWPLLMVLRYGDNDGAANAGRRSLTVWRDAIDDASWRGLAVALTTIGRHGDGGRAHGKIR